MVKNQRNVKVNSDCSLLYKMFCFECDEKKILFFSKLLKFKLHQRKNFLKCFILFPSFHGDHFALAYFLSHNILRLFWDFVRLKKQNKKRLIFYNQSENKTEKINVTPNESPEIKVYFSLSETLHTVNSDQTPSFNKVLGFSFVWSFSIIWECFCLNLIPK